MKHWECTICGYIHEGEEPPERCPVCDAPKELFFLRPERPEGPKNPRNDTVRGASKNAGDVGVRVRTPVII